MPAAGYVTVALAVVVVLVLAAFLLGIARVLIDLDKRLDNVIGAVGSIASATAPVDGVVRSINGNLATARDVLNNLLVSKVGADGAAELVASVDPLADGSPTQSGGESIQYERPYQPEVADEAAALPATGAPIQYERAYEEEAPPWGAPPVDEPAVEADRISLMGGPGTSGFDPVYDEPVYDEPAPAEEPPAPPAEADRISLMGGPGASTFEPVYEPEPEPEPAPPEPEPEPAPPPPPPPEPGPAPTSRPPGSGGGGVRFNLPDE